MNQFLQWLLAMFALCVGAYAMAHGVAEGCRRRSNIDPGSDFGGNTPLAQL